MSDQPGLNADQVTYWNADAGRRWAEQQTQLDRMFAPLTEAAMRLAAAAPGERVVDIGCGCGATLVALADRVGTAGHVLGLDVSTPMLAVARTRTVALPQVALQEADAARQAFSGDAQLLFSRFGVMFFDAPEAAFSNLRSALAPGGRLAMVVWRGVAENPWFGVPRQAVDALVPAEPPADPDAPGPFAFADESRVRSILSAAGFSRVTVTPHDTQLRLPGSLQEAALFATQIGPAAKALAEAGTETVSTARTMIADALRRYQTDDGIILVGAVWLVSARA